MKQLEEDRLENDRLRTQLIQDERKMKTLESLLQERDNEISRLKLVSSRRTALAANMCRVEKQQLYKNTEKPHSGEKEYLVGEQ